jgi:phospholipase C
MAVRSRAYDAGSQRSAAASQARISRRRFIGGAAATVGALALGNRSVAAPIGRIDHVVVVMMENRSFDHFLGWLPGADGAQAGLTYYDGVGTPHQTHPLAPDYQGCGHPDPDHSYEGGRVEYDNGACDGWLRAGINDDYAIGYYVQGDLAFLGQAAASWTACDHYFAAILAETYPNRIYQHAAQTDRIRNTNTLCTLPTIWDRLGAAGLSRRYYYSDVPFLALWGSRYVSISRPVAAFFADCAAGTLPNVAFVDPRFLDEESGTSGDDHPHADIRNGEAFMNGVYEAVTASPNWSSTVLVFNYDEWGGFFDHVPPSVAPADRATGNADGLRGFRTPCVLVSPWARRAHVAGTLYDHTSILRMIECRWRLAPLTVRDRTANNLAAELDFTRRATPAPHFNVPTGPFGSPCAAGSTPVEQEWTDLLALAQAAGWPV